MVVLIGGAFLILDKCGVMKYMMASLIKKFSKRKYTLMAINKETIVSINDLKKFHFIFKKLEMGMDLRNLLNAWKYRSEYFEKNLLSGLSVESVHYGKNLEICLFALGMCQNAIQYLSQIIEDYGEKIENVTLTHKRLENLNFFDFFNPFNFVIDNPVRDYAELYRNSNINYNVLVECLDFYNFSTKEVSLFIARIMYPVQILDLIERNIEKKEKNFNLNFHINNELLKIKKVYLFFREVYHIRPISWLE